jgi:MATE family multidrug resistance protein
MTAPAHATAADPRPAGLRALLGLAWPVVVSRASQVVIGVCDALMVAGLGESALAATTTGALNVFSIFIFPMGVVLLVASFSSQLFGRGDLAGARRYGFYGLGVAAATELVCLAVWAYDGPLLRHLSYAPDVRRLIHDYLDYRLLSGGAAIGIEALGNYYGGLGNTRLPMRASLAAMILNVLGCWLFIGGHLGAPALGVKGSGLAASLATTIAFAGLLAKFLLDGRTKGRKGRVVPRLHLGEALRMLRFGLPSGFNWFFEFLAFMFFVNVVVAGLGTTSLAAFMVAMQVNSVSFMPAFGLASAGAILVGQAIGRGDKDAVPGFVRLTFLTAAVWQGSVAILYVGLPRLIFSAFVRGPAAGTPLMEVGTRVLMLSAAWQLFDAAGITLSEALRAAGDTAFPMRARLVLAWVLFAPGAYLSVQVFGWRDTGAVFWLVLYLGILAAALYIRFRRGAWRAMQLTDHLPVGP